ncbi:MAG: hypothetical protein MI861_26695, partial [Pirellulales bacterium]|nr:hypothetical protein [Pirellulales bacterium]
FHPIIVKTLTGRDEEDTFPTFYRANSRGRIVRLASAAGFEVTSLTMLREHPHYLQFNSLAYAMGVAYEQSVERIVHAVRPWILCVCTRKA